MKPRRRERQKIGRGGRSDFIDAIDKAVRLGNADVILELLREDCPLSAGEIFCCTAPCVSDTTRSSMSHSRPNRSSRQELKRIKEMASFYAEFWIMNASQLNARLDAFKKRWPDSTQRERILAHRLGDAMITNSGNKNRSVFPASQ